MLRLRSLIVISAAAFVGAAALALPAPAGEVKHSAVVSDNPADHTPHILDGQVKAIAVVAGRVIVGGEFSEVEEAAGDDTLDRSNIFAFDEDTGRIDRNFAPTVDGTVDALAPGPDGTVMVGGSFRAVDGSDAAGLARLRVSDGTPAGSFAAANGPVRALAAHGGSLYVGGRFSRVNGVSRSGLARLDANDGSVDRGFRIRPGESRKGALRVIALALSPDGSRLAIGGTFTRVDGKPRPQLALVDTGSSPARLAGWATRAYADRCLPAFETYLRDIDFSPDGSYFAVVTTGGPGGPRRTCDSAARFETGTPGGDVRPTWVNRTGGDSLYAVAATGAAVYVGGHQRWMDNPQGRDSAGPGAVSRPGIAALDPRTGKALGWNPTKSRGRGVEALVASPRGLYVGSDTDRLGGEYHARIGMFAAGQRLTGSLLGLP
ncbi:MAG: hypothetical protein GEV03_20590 [Streptosporangiales bacterium]|nr:hypothetical protein [Streptosporangiales bacterium]